MKKLVHRFFLEHLISKVQSSTIFFLMYVTFFLKIYEEESHFCLLLQEPFRMSPIILLLLCH